MQLPLFDDLYLRLMTHADAPDIFATIQREREYLGEWLPFVDKTHALSDTEAFIGSVLDVPEQEKEWVFTIRNAKAEFIGLIGFHDTDTDNHKSELGYWLSQAHQGRGIITKAVQTLCEYAFKEMGIHRIQIRCAVGNTASQRIPLKLGFLYEGIERDGECVKEDIYRDIEVYSLLKTDSFQKQIP